MISHCLKPKHVVPFLAIVLFRFETWAEPLQCINLFPSIYNLSPTNEKLRAHMEELAQTGLPMYDSQKSDHHIVHLTETAFAIESWKVQTLKASDGHTYNLLDVGFANFKQDLPKLEQIYTQHFESDQFKVPLEVKDEGARKRAIEESRKWRWGFHDAVINAYATHPFKKKYLDIHELSALNFQTTLNENSDVFGIISAPSRPLSTLSQQEIFDSTVITLQLTYATPSYTKTTAIDLASFIRKVRGLQPQKYLPFMERMKYPHQKLPEDTVQSEGPIRPRRVPTIDISEFLKKFNAEFAGRNVAEANRWAKPIKDSPPELQDLIWLTIFERAEKNHVEVLFASTDRATKKLLKDTYGFEPYCDIKRPIVDENGNPTGDFAENEYAVKIEIGSEKYLEVKNRLKASIAKNLGILTQPFVESP